MQKLAQEVADEACGPLLQAEKDYQQALKRIERIAGALRFETNPEVIEGAASTIRELLQVVEVYAHQER